MKDGDEREKRNKQEWECYIIKNRGKNRKNTERIEKNEGTRKER